MFLFLMIGCACFPHIFSSVFNYRALDESSQNDPRFYSTNVFFKYLRFLQFRLIHNLLNTVIGSDSQNRDALIELTMLATRFLGTKHRAL